MLFRSLGLRATAGEGGHVTVEDAVDAVYAHAIPEFSKPTFERLRRTRHAAQYFDPSHADVDIEDARWAIAIAFVVVESVKRLLSDLPMPGE